MLKDKITNIGAFTIIELVIVVGFISLVLFAGIGIVLCDTQRGWNRMYDRMYSDVITESYVARRVFDREVRKASCETYSLDPAGSWIEVYSYADSNSAVVDRYSYFYVDNGCLKLEYGKISPREPIHTSPVCENVTSCVFKAIGRSAQMILTLGQDSQTVNITSSSVMQNQ